MFHHQSGGTPLAAEWGVHALIMNDTGTSFDLVLLVVLKWAPSLENWNKTQQSLPDSKLCRISMHLTSHERCLTSVDPQSGMGRKTHLALWCSTGWLSPPLCLSQTRGEMSRLSSLSASRLSAPFSVLTFPQHDEHPCDIYALLLFPPPGILSNTFK